MKKIILTGFLITAMYIANAQTTNTTEANKSALSKQVGDPLVNGIPYSQYKAQQEAAKQARLAEDTKAIADAKASATANAATNPNVHAPAATAPAKQPIGEIAVKSVPEPLPAALKGTSLDPNAKPVVTSAKTPAVNVPASNSGNTQADAAIATPVENAKRADTKQAAQTTSAARPLFNQQVSAANTELLQPANTNAAPAIQMPEVKTGASGTSPIEEVKPSENAKQPKVPVAGKQGGSN